MSHKAALEMLIPLQLGGVHDTDLTVEAAQLDLAANDIEALRQIIVTDSVELVPTSDRIKMVPIRLDILKPFYIALAAALGYTIRIDDYLEAQSDWLCADDDLWEEPWRNFTAGISSAGDFLGQSDSVLNFIWEVVVLETPAVIPTPSLEAIITDLRPAHIWLNWRYL